MGKGWPPKRCPATDVTTAGGSPAVNHTCREAENHTGMHHCQSCSHTWL